MNVSTCALCPRLCRSSCPAATGSGREAATPSVIAGAILEFERGKLDEADLVHHLTLCTDCGGCQDHCHLHLPLPALLAEWRGAHLPPPPIAPLGRIKGTAKTVIIESDERELADALSRAIGEPVATFRTPDRLGVAAIEHDAIERHLVEVARLFERRMPVVIDGGVAEVLQRAEVGFRWLRDVVRELPQGHRSCRQGGHDVLRCCGGAGPLHRFHADDAERLGKLWLRRTDDWQVEDARCRRHLRGCGGTVVDPADALLERYG